MTEELMNNPIEDPSPQVPANDGEAGTAPESEETNEPAAEAVDDSELTEEEKQLKEEALDEITGEHLKQIIESVLFVSEEPITMEKFKQVLGARVKAQAVRDIVEELRKEYDDDQRAFMVIEVAQGFQLVTRAQYSHWLTKLYKGKKERFLSKSSLETLSIVAYREPITRAEIEAIRGVNVDGVIKTLLDRNLIKIVGKKEVPGRPMLYGTTKKFLEYFGLKSKEELPKLPDTDPQEELKIRESLRNQDQIDAEGKGLREEQPIIEDDQMTVNDDNLMTNDNGLVTNNE